MDCSPPGSFAHGIFQAKNWSGLPFPSLESFLTQGSNLSPALQADSLLLRGVLNRQPALLWVFRPKVRYCLDITKHNLNHMFSLLLVLTHTWVLRMSLHKLNTSLILSLLLVLTHKWVLRMSLHKLNTSLILRYAMFWKAEEKVIHIKKSSKKEQNNFIEINDD